MPESPADTAREGAMFADSQTRLPLNGITVLDLTLARAGPTAVRHFADWGANVIRIEPPAERGRGCRRPPPRLRLPEPAPQQARRHAEPEVQGRPRGVHAAGRQGRRGAGEHAGQREAPPEGLLRGREGDQPAHRLRQHLRLRPGRPVRPARRRRPDRPGHGRADVDHRRAGPRADARRHPDRRPDRRQPAGARLHDGAVRPRAHRRRPLGHHLAAGGADLHARLPGQPLADGRRGRRTGRQRPPDRHPHRRVPDQRRPHQHRRQFVARVHPLLRGDRPHGLAGAGRTGRPRSAAARTARRSTPRSPKSPRRSRRTTGSSCSRPTASPAARSTRSTRCSPIRRSSISAWRRR